MTPAEAMTKPPIVAALSAVMTEVQTVRKGDRNTQQGYSFRGIDAVVNAVGPALRKHGIVCVPLVEDVSYNVVEVGKQRTQMRECTVRVRYVFHGPAGDRIECVSIGEAMDSGDKATPKAMSVAYRVALLQALCIPTDEPDADSTAYERSERREEAVWDPLQQEQLREQWELEIEQAKTREELAEIAGRISAAKKAPPDDPNRISPATSDRLLKAWSARRGELNGAAMQPAEAATAPAGEPA